MSEVTHFPGKDDIRHQAATWLIRLDGSPFGEDEVRALQDWVNTSKYHREALFDLARTWDDTAVLSQLAEILPYPGSGKQATKSLTGSLFPALAAALVVVVTLLWIAPFGSSPLESQRYSTAVGQRASYRLPDGSRVDLNTGSQLSVSFSDANRIVRLTKGEAHFKVAKNPERPFIVYAGSGLIRAVGTAFNVRLSGNKTDVIVTEGRVKVASHIPSAVADDAAGREALFLSVGQAATVADDMHIVDHVLTHEELERKLAWQSGYLVFQGETLGEALDEVGRYTDKKLIIMDDELRQIRVGGRYRVDDIDALLSALAVGFNIHVEQRQDNVIALSSQ